MMIIRQKPVPNYLRRKKITTETTTLMKKPVNLIRKNTQWLCIRISRRFVRISRVFNLKLVENPILEEINFQFSVYWEQETLVPGDRLRASRSRREQWYSSADAGWPAGDSALSLEWIRVQELFDQSQQQRRRVDWVQWSPATHTWQRQCWWVTVIEWSWFCIIISCSDASGNVERFIAVPVSPSYLTDHLRSLHQTSINMSSLQHTPGHRSPRCRSPDSVVTIPPTPCTSLVSAQVSTLSVKNIWKV